MRQYDDEERSQVERIVGRDLDETTGKQIVDLLFSKHAERGMTLVLVTHDSSLAHRCDRVIRLRSGRIDTQTAPA